MVHSILGRLDRQALKRNGFTLAVIENALP